MSVHGDVAPATIGVELLEEGVEVEYLDGRRTLYRGVPEPVADSLTTPPGKEVHVLVTDPAETEGVMIYVNDRKTHDEILDSTGVGRILLEKGEEEELFPGVHVRQLPGHREEIEADPEQAQGRVFVFVEDEWSEASYELVDEDSPADDEAASDDSSAGESSPDDVSATDDSSNAEGTGTGRKTKTSDDQ